MIFKAQAMIWWWSVFAMDGERQMLPLVPLHGERQMLPLVTYNSGLELLRCVQMLQRVSSQQDGRERPKS